MSAKAKSRRAKRFIVKIQRPIETNDKDRPWLFYDKGRTFYQTFPENGLPPEVVNWFKDCHTFKAYFEASIGKDGKLMLDYPVAWLNEDQEIIDGFESNLWKGEF